LGACLIASAASLSAVWWLRRRQKARPLSFAGTIVGAFAVITVALIGFVVYTTPPTSSLSPITPTVSEPPATATATSGTMMTDSSGTMMTDTTGATMTDTAGTTVTDTSGATMTDTTGATMTTGTMTDTTPATGTDTTGTMGGTGSTGATGVTGMTDPTGTAGATAERLRDWFASGAAAFNPKKEMKQGNAETVTLRIVSAANDDPRRTEPLPGGPTTFVWPQEVSQVMCAGLSGEGFAIIPITPAEQYLRNGLYEWSWAVTPTKWGDRELRLTISTLAPFAGMTEKASVAHVKRRSILIHVSPWFVAGTALENYWQWLATAIGIPLIVWLWSKRTTKARKAGF